MGGVWDGRGVGWEGVGWEGVGWEGMGWEGVGWEGYTSAMRPLPLFRRAKNQTVARQLE